MTDEKQPVSYYLKLMPFTGYILYFGLGLLFFFLSAFIVILVRTKSDTMIVMPDLVGQNYVDVHNELMRMRLKVRIESKRYIDKNDGEILYQSVSPGKKLESGSKLYLTVNNGVDRVIVPDFRGQQLNSAKALLDKVISGDSYVSMDIGGITYVPVSEGLSPDTVIDQIPEPGKNTTTREKIYLLVTESGNKNDKSSSINDNILGNPFPFVATSLQKKNIRFKLKDIISTKDKRENGLVTQVEDSSGFIQLAVSLFPLEEKNKQGYESFGFKANKKNKYSATGQSLRDENLKFDIFNSLDLEEGEKFQYVFYRVGDVVVDITNENEVINSIKFKSEYKK
jgi:beta-lactam-binding protein with PASTA domain